MPPSNRDWRLDHLLDELSSEPLPPVRITGLCQDSRRVMDGDLYLALAGHTTHGLCFAQAAIAAGAVAVLCSAEALDTFVEIVTTVRSAGVPVVGIARLEQKYTSIAARFYGSPDQDLLLIAVTGTDGKTSVCRFITQSFNALGRPCGYIGTLGWGLGDELQGTDLTTPDAVSLRRMLASLKEQGAVVVALEASSHGLAEGRLDGLALDVAVLTNLGRDHLDYHISIEAYRDAKARLFRWPDLRAVVLNGNDAFGRELLAMPATPERYVYFTAPFDSTALAQTPAQTPAEVKTPTKTQAQTLAVTADDIATQDSGLTFRLREGTEEGLVTTSLLGRFNVDNLLACYASLRACEVAANQARHALDAVRPVAGRMERFGQASQPTVVVDYSHTPQALGVAIAAARVHCRGRLWVVFGCGGDRDRGKRVPMAAAAEAADVVVLTDDNPRTERSEDIIADAMQGFREPFAVTVIADRALAIRHAVTHAAADDLVLVAGKGHEDYQIIGTTRHPFSDRLQVLSALEQAS